jgi:endonuclease-3
LKSPSNKTLSLRKQRLLQAIARWEAQEPNPRCELYYETPYQLLVSVLLSAQTTDKMVNRCMEPLYRAGFSPATVLAWGEEKLLSQIRSIGLAPTKARHVVAMTGILLDKHAGTVPESAAELEALPGVGPKTANVIRGEIFGYPTLAVDTHVLRVSARMGVHEETNPLKAEKALLQLAPSGALPRLHHWLVLHGRYVCKAAKPACGACLLADLCPKVGL